MPAVRTDVVMDAQATSCNTLTMASSEVPAVPASYEQSDSTSNTMSYAKALHAAEKFAVRPLAVARVLPVSTCAERQPADVAKALSSIVSSIEAADILATSEEALGVTAPAMLEPSQTQVATQGSQPLTETPSQMLRCATAMAAHAITVASSILNCLSIYGEVEIELVTRVQASVRGRAVRKQLKVLLNRQAVAVARLQAVQRGKMVRKWLEKQVAAAVQVQAAERGRMARKSMRPAEDEKAEPPTGRQMALVLVPGDHEDELSPDRSALASATLPLVEAALQSERLPSQLAPLFTLPREIPKVLTVWPIDECATHFRQIRSPVSVLPWLCRAVQHEPYEIGQKLVVLIKDQWIDAEVTAPPSASRISHLLQLPDGRQERAFLSPWNHTTQGLADADFKRIRERYTNDMREEHTTVACPIRGTKIDVTEQCIKLSLDHCCTSSAPSDVSPTWRDVDDLAAWFVDTIAMKALLTKLIAHLLELKSSFVAELGSKPSFAAAWLMEQLMNTSRQIQDELPEPWSNLAIQSIERLMDRLAAMDAIFAREIEDLRLKHIEVKQQVEAGMHQQFKTKREANRQAKVAHTLQQKHTRDEHEILLKSKVQELPADKRDEYLGLQRNQMMSEQRIEVEQFEKWQEMEQQQLEADQKGRRACVDIAQAREVDELTNDQWQRPLQLLEQELLGELETLVNASTCALLSGNPGAGKSCLVSQLLLRIQGDHGSHLVPIVIRASELQTMLLDPAKAVAFINSWNWIDVYLAFTHGSQSERYRRATRTLI